MFRFRSVLDSGAHYSFQALRACGSADSIWQVLGGGGVEEIEPARAAVAPTWLAGLISDDYWPVARMIVQGDKGST
jgi:hypothetical protein